MAVTVNVTPTPTAVVVNQSAPQVTVESTQAVNNINSSIFNLNTPVPGPQGPEGPKGDPGAPGEKGDKGDDGGVQPVGAATPSSWRFALTRSENGSYMFGSVQGSEYAIGISLGPVTVTSLKIHGGFDADTTFRVGLRPIIAGVIGAPVADVAFVGPVSGAVEMALPGPVALDGHYALTWCRYGDTEDTLRLQRGGAGSTPHLFSLQAATTWAATGHGPIVGILNSGISGPLPTTISQVSVSTNFAAENSWVPQIEAKVA